MISKDQAVAVIVEELKTSAADAVAGKSASEIGLLVLVGQGTALDSLALIGVIAGVEAKLKERHGLAITLFNEKAMVPESSPIRTVDAMADSILAQARG